jgi:hypothetical protein
LGTRFSIVHFYLGDNFSQWRPHITVSLRIIVSICSQILQLSLFQLLGISFLLY